MELKKIWISRNHSGKNSFALHSIGGTLGICALALLLAGGGTLLALERGISVKGFSMALCCAVTALVLFLALSLGRRTVQEATVFFLTEDDKLFALDARELADGGRNTIDQLLHAVKVQHILEELAGRPGLPEKASEIVSVESLKDKGGYLAAVCRVRSTKGRLFSRCYFLVQGLENEEELIRQLERRKNWRNALEERDSGSSVCIPVSAACLVSLVILCVLSHPAVGRLPGSFYFPCLLGTFAAVMFLAYFLVRQSRGG